MERKQGDGKVVRGPFIIFSAARHIQWLFSCFDQRTFRKKLAKAGLNVTPPFYFAVSFLNTCLYTIFFTFLVLVGCALLSLPFAVLPAASVLIFVCLCAFFLLYPSLLMRKRAALLDKDLFFALQDLSIQITSGISLYNALKNIAKGNYGEVSYAFRTVINEVDTGTPLEIALANILESTESEHFRKTLWQVLGVLKSGANLESALKSVVYSLKKEQQGKIAAFLHEVNLWVLIYLLIAVTIPSIFAALVSVLLSISGRYADVKIFVFIAAAAVLVQMLLLYYVKIRMPIVSL